MASLLPRPPAASRCATARCRRAMAVQAAAQQQLGRRDVLAATGGAFLLPLLAAGGAQAKPSSPFLKPGAKDMVFTTPTQELLKDLGVASWPTWSHGVDSFPYVYGEDEDCFFLEGKVVVTPTGGLPVVIRAGDFVSFPEGMACTWDILEPVRKHYKEYAA